MATVTLDRKRNTTLTPTVDRKSLTKACKTCGAFFRHANYHQWQCYKCDPEPFEKHERRRENDKNWYHNNKLTKDS